MNSYKYEVAGTMPCWKIASISTAKGKSGGSEGQSQSAEYSSLLAILYIPMKSHEERLGIKPATPWCQNEMGKSLLCWGWTYLPDGRI